MGGTCTSLVHLLTSRSTAEPDRCAFIYLKDGETDEARMSYAELDRDARAVASRLLRMASPGARVLLLFPPGLEYVAAFFGCLYAGMIAVPAYPPQAARLERSLPRLRAVVQSARPEVVLSVSSFIPMTDALRRAAPEIGALRWEVVDRVPRDHAESFAGPEPGPDTLAFVQYTSGSTSLPRGVALSHGNLLHNSALIQRTFQDGRDSQGVIWLPPYHDMGLIGGILQPLYVGYPMVLMSPVHFMQRPLRWLEAMTRYRATTSAGPNFAYDLCARRVKPRDRDRLDLRHWKVAINGA